MKLHFKISKESKIIVIITKEPKIHFKKAEGKDNDRKTLMPY